MADGNSPEVKIKVSADTRQADGALKRLNSAFAAAGRGIAAFTRAMGVVGFALHGIQYAVDAFKTFHAWVTKGRTEAENLRRTLEQARYERGVERAAEEYKKLNSELERTLRLERERAAIADRRTAGRRDAEDARMELAKQREIAALDPASEDYAKRKQEIEDRYAAKAANTAASRAQADAATGAGRLRKELAEREGQIAGQKASRAADLESAAAARREINYRQGRRPWLDAMGPLGGDEREKNEARIEELRKREKAANDRAAEKAEAIRAAEDVAAVLREKIDAALGGAAGAQDRAAAARLAVAQGVRERAAADARAEQSKAEAEQKREADAAKKAEARQLELEKQQEIAGIELDDPRYEEKRKAIERQFAYRAAGLEEDADARAAAQLAVDNEIRAEAAAEARGEREKRIGELEGFSDRLAATEGVSANRLAALGLGSGVEGRSGIAGDVRKIIDLLQEEIAATKDNKPERADGVAVVGE